MVRYSKGDRIIVKSQAPMYKTLDDCKNEINIVGRAQKDEQYSILQNGIRIGGTSSDPIYAYELDCYLHKKDENGNITSTEQVSLWMNGKVLDGIRTNISSSNVNGDSVPSYNPINNNATQYGSFSSENINIGDINSYSPMVNDPYGKDNIFTLSEETRKSFLNDKDIRQSIFNMGIIDREDRDAKDPSKDLLLYNKFDRNGCVDPYNGFIGSKEYVFFTRPDLHLFEEIDNSNKLNEELVRLPLFEDYFERYPHIFEILQSSCKTNRTPFIPILSNTISSPIQLPDLQARLIETGTNAYGTKISYRGTSHPSDEDISFSTEFTDNRYMEVFTLFKLFDEYEKQKNLGYITPRTSAYVVNKILYDQISIFKMVVAEDGESLLYFAKWTGCLPMNVPTDSLSDMANISGNLNLSINWHASFFEDMDKEILQDFNAVVLNHVGEEQIKADESKDIKLFDPVTNMSNGEWASYPYIASIQENNGLELNRLKKMRRYKLKWR